MALNPADTDQASINSTLTLEAQTRVKSLTASARENDDSVGEDSDTLVKNI
jgi:hypothetical protein